MAEDYDLTRVRAAFALALAIRRQTKGRVYMTFRANLYATPHAELLLHGEPAEVTTVMASLGPIKQHYSDGRVFLEVRTQFCNVETNWPQDKPVSVDVSAEDKAQAESVVQG